MQFSLGHVVENTIRLFDFNLRHAQFVEFDRLCVHKSWKKYWYNKSSEFSRLKDGFSASNKVLDIIWFANIHIGIVNIVGLL